MCFIDLWSSLVSQFQLVAGCSCFLQRYQQPRSPPNTHCSSIPLLSLVSATRASIGKIHRVKAMGGSGTEHARRMTQGGPNRRLPTDPQGAGGWHDACDGLLSEAGGAYQPPTPSPCPSLNPLAPLARAPIGLSPPGALPLPALLPASGGRGVIQGPAQRRPTPTPPPQTNFPQEKKGLLKGPEMERRFKAHKSGAAGSP